MKKRLIVFSADAMVCEDLPYLATLPNFRRYFGGYAQAESLRSIYPTITYPVHTTLMTGLYPKDHGVISNDQLVAGETNRPWHWFREELQGRDLYSRKGSGLDHRSRFLALHRPPSPHRLLNRRILDPKCGRIPRGCFSQGGLLARCVEHHSPPRCGDGRTPASHVR